MSKSHKANNVSMKLKEPISTLGCHYINSLDENEVIDEEELNKIKELKALKGNYRESFQKLK